jgi:cell division protein FtsN
MSRDYRKPSTARTPPRSQTKRRKPQQKSPSTRGFSFFLSGVAVGALLTALILVPQLGKDFDATDMTSDEKQVQQKKPRFDFYTLLGENEAVVTDDEPEPEERIAVQTNKPVQPFVYLLQVGSFKNSGDADSLRAKLLLMNFEVKVDPIKSNSDVVWHRVIVGPYTNHGSMGQARDKLASNEIDVLLLKRKK